MTNLPNQTISAIVSSESVLEEIITKLTEKTVARHDINVQGSPTKIAEKYGKSYVDPDIIKESRNPPKKEHFLEDDFGWVVGFVLWITVTSKKQADEALSILKGYHAHEITVS
ncbi:hypothetical protein [Legionella hackeliae]|uniref:Uncharacterized protein n=1 Tax=Legionella hackeliae TaxID=449 RepID=A0A0A8UX85_LEGHA|nr:hypothetical protein [Legionella hackeliae]KTD09981.1 hypothetical protein Lhac_2349 [Legionella hackeliae]CEK11717.1 protein of unknown function [Legionella hackeliae]STX48487.1 Uncharacterised protein [Legionella hackeliae]